MLSLFKDIIVKMFKVLTGKEKLFSKSEYNAPVIETFTPPTRPRDVLLNSIDYSVYMEPDIVNNEGTRSILIIDDVSESDVLYKVDFGKIKRNYNKDTNCDFKTVKCFHPTAGYMAFKYILAGNKIDYAILDLSLDLRVQVGQGEYVTIDGIDVAMLIRKFNPKAKFLISTVHTMSKDTPTLSYYYKKYKENFTDELMDHYLNKNSDRHLKIHDFLYEV